MSMIIDLDLLFIKKGLKELQELKGQVYSGKQIPSVQGSGCTAEAIRKAAEEFLHMETVWDALLTESIEFFEKTYQAHEEQQQQLAEALGKVFKKKDV